MPSARLMRPLTALMGAFAGALLGCGARTGLAIEDELPPELPSVDERCRRGDLGPYDVLRDAPGLTEVAAGGRVWWAGGVFNAPLGWVPRDGGEPSWLRDAEPAIDGVVVRGRDVYWLTQGMGEHTGELRGIESGRFRTLAADFFRPASLHLVDGHFYFADGTSSGTLRDEGRGRVLRVPERGGPAEVLEDDLWLPTSVAVGPTHVYWVDQGRGQLGRVLRNGGDAEILIEELSRPSDLSVFEGALYFASGGMVLRTDLEGRATETVVDLGDEIRGLLATEVGIFGELWDSRIGGSSLVWAPPDGRPPELIDDGGRAPVADTTRVYWTVGEIRGGIIRGACKDHFRTP